MTEAGSGGSDVAARVYAAVKQLVSASFEGLGCIYGRMPDDVGMPCLAVVSIDGEPIGRRYIDGGCIENYRFALMLREKAADDQARLETQRTIGQIASTIEETVIDLGEGRQFWGVEKDALPCCVADKEGCCDWRVTLVLTYKVAA